MEPGVGLALLSRCLHRHGLTQRFLDQHLQVYTNDVLLLRSHAVEGQGPPPQGSPTEGFHSLECSLVRLEIPTTPKCNILPQRGSDCQEAAAACQDNRGLCSLPRESRAGEPHAAPGGQHYNKGISAELGLLFSARCFPQPLSAQGHK